MPATGTAAPRPLQQAVRYTCSRLRTPMTALRMQPAFIVTGAPRGGTTSLFRALIAHPQAVPPASGEGVSYFDLNYHRGARWYRGHFPIAEIARRTTHGRGEPAAFEASGYYLYHPFAIERMARELPAVKLVVMLRDPVERAYSAYQDSCARGLEWESFETALELEDERLAGEIDRMRRDPAYQSFPHRHQSYRHRGQYADQLGRVYRHFPQSRVHIIESQSFFAQPAVECQRLLRFLGLPPLQPASFGCCSGQPGPPMLPRTRKLLEEHYRPHDKRLAILLGRPPAWAR